MGHHPPHVKRASGNSPPTLPDQVGERRKENGASVRMGGLYLGGAAIASQRRGAMVGIWRRIAMSSPIIATKLAAGSSANSI